MMKVIVNPAWLDFLPLATAEKSRLAAGLLGNEKLSGLLIKGGAKFDSETLSLLAEKAAQISGQPARILELSHNLSALRPTESKNPIWEERAFLKGFAYSRLGKEKEADAFFTQLAPRFQAGIRIEKALLRLNRGELVEAAGIFAIVAESGEPLDPFTACTLLGGWSLALIQQGDFIGAEQALRERRRILRLHPSPTLAFGTKLYEMLLRLERNDFTEAGVALERSLVEIPRASVNGFFLRHLELRLQLARNQLGAAEISLKNLDSLRRELQFPEGVLDFRLEEIEWNLRRQEWGAAHAAIEALRPSAERDQYLLFRLSLLEAQALAQSGNHQEAFRQIQGVIELGEARRYRPGLSWAFLHAAGISLGAGHPLAARIFLSRGRHLSAELHLTVRLAGFSYMAEVLEQKFASSSALLSLARHQEIGPELEYFLNAYGLLNEVSLTVSSAAGREIVEEPRLRRQLFLAAGIFWFQKESVLLANDGVSRRKSIELSPGTPITALFRLLWSAAQGETRRVTLKDVHALRSKASFREHLHAGAAKMLVTRLRHKLKSADLLVTYDRPSGSYSLASPLPFLTILSGTDAPARDRKAELLARIAMEPFVRTSRLREELGVSRQAVHAYLKELCDEGKIRLVNRGPSSGYIYNSK